MTSRQSRLGFTLLEMILALAISLVLMTAVYMMLDTQFTQAKAGRDATEESTLVRSVFASISNDVAGSLGPYDPHMQADAAPATSAPASSDSTTAATETTTTGAAATPTSSAFTFNIGVQGDASQLVLTVGRAGKRRLESGDKVSDLRRVTYWVAEGRGLMQWVVDRVTSTDIDVESPDADQGKVFAAEVKSITFQYWDGSGWTSSWNSSEPGADGDTPIGPPAAIEIVIELQRPATTVEEGAEPPEPRRFRHVVALPTGNNYSAAP